MPCRLLPCSIPLLALALAACNDVTVPEGDIIFIEVDGTVRSDANGDVIPGAAVTLGIGDAGDPLTLDTDITDEFGRYEVSDTLQDFRADNCYAWIVVAAAGYQASSMNDTRNRVECTLGRQAVSIFLTPLPAP